MQAANLLESPLTMLTLVSDPSVVTHARSVDALPREAVLLAGLWRPRGLGDEHQVNHNN